MNKRKHALEIVKKLSEEYPEVKCHLDFKNAFELIVSTVLAAQCTDIRVNMVMVPLYKSKYKKPSDIIKDGEDGFLVKNGDEETFAEKLQLLIKDENLRKEMGEKARENVQRFSPQNVVKQWDELFKKINPNEQAKKNRT